MLAPRSFVVVVRRDAVARIVVGKGRLGPVLERWCVRLPLDDGVSGGSKCFGAS
jgi:hypothetical protein